MSLYSLQDRIVKGIIQLEDLAAPIKGRDHPDEVRLRGKIEGLKLALSYLHDEINP